MLEEILKHRPKGATHWDVGTYYKKDGDKWFYWDRLWFRVADISTLNKWMTTLPDEKDPAMSEFKTGDYVVLVEAGTSDDLLQVIDHKYSDDVYRVKILSKGLCGPVHKREIRPAKKEEIEAGKRLDNDMGDDFPIENHISPNCQSRDV